MSYFQRRKRNRTTPANAQLEESHTSLLTNVQNSSTEKSKSKSFKLMKGRNGPITFLPLNCHTEVPSVAVITKTAYNFIEFH